MRFSRVYLEITNVCNLRCGFCPGTERQPQFLSPAAFEVLLGKLRGRTDYLCFHLMGEPLLHPQLSELLALAERYGYYVNITTNGVLLPEAAETLLNAPSLHRVSISLQAWEGNGCTWDVNSYVNSCAAFAKRAAARGVLVYFRLWNGGAPGNERLLAALRSAFPAPWKEAGRFDWPDAAGPERAGRFCRGLRDHIGVLCDGTVVPCCLDSEGTVALGNLFEQELEEILASPRALAIYEGFTRREAVEALCRHCGYAERFG
jgi:MoaA/NifB/PqqE/SkfB family radical SAM enzyme